MVKDFGITPNWSGSKIDSISGLMYVTTLKPSATFDNAEVGNIGLRCLLAPVTGLVFIRGVIFASFQAEENFCSREVLFNMVQTGSARTSANSFNNLFRNSSGPDALRGLSLIQTAQEARTPRHKEREIVEVDRLASTRRKHC